jgi:hypothetical protein
LIRHWLATAGASELTELVANFIETPLHLPITDMSKSQVNLLHCERDRICALPLAIPEQDLAPSARRLDRFRDQEWLQMIGLRRNVDGDYASSRVGVTGEPGDLKSLDTWIYPIANDSVVRLWVNQIASISCDSGNFVTEV